MAIKKGELDDTLVISFFETLGEERIVEIKINAIELEDAQITNLLEEPFESLEITEGNKVRIKTKPFEIVTVKFKIAY